MKKISRTTPQISITTYVDQYGGEYYSLYVNGKWENEYSSLSQVTAAIQALILGIPYTE